MAFEKPNREQIKHRYSYHAPKGDQVERYAAIRTAVEELAWKIVEMTPCSPEQARALNSLDEAMMLANAAIARNE